MSARRSGRYSITPACVYDDARLTNAHRDMLGLLGTYANRDGWAWPDQATLAARIGVTQSAISQRIKTLRDLGYLDVTARRDARGKPIGAMYRLRLDYVLPAGCARVPIEDESDPEAPPEPVLGALIAPGPTLAQLNGHISSANVYISSPNDIENVPMNVPKERIPEATPPAPDVTRKNKVALTVDAIRERGLETTVNARGAQAVKKCGGSPEQIARAYVVADRKRLEGDRWWGSNLALWSVCDRLDALLAEEQHGPTISARGGARPGLPREARPRGGADPRLTDVAAKWNALG